MKIVLFSGFPLDSSYNYTVNTNDWDTLVAQYYGMTREVLYEKISTSIEFNFIDRDSVHGSCTIDLATVTKIVKPNKTAKISTDYNYAIVYDNINNEYKHYFITGWDFVSSKKIGESFNNVYNVSFSLNLLAYFNVCETNNKLPKNILVDRTHIWDNVSKYSSEGQGIEPNCLTEYNPEYWTMFDKQIGNNKWYYVITTKSLNKHRETKRTYMGGTSSFYCYCLCSGEYYVSSYLDKNDIIAEFETVSRISDFSTFLSSIRRGKVAVDDIVKIYCTTIPPVSYMLSLSGNNQIKTVSYIDGTSIYLPDKDEPPEFSLWCTMLNLGDITNNFISSLRYSNGNNKLGLYPFKQLLLVDNNTVELEPNFIYQLRTALSPTKLSFVITRTEVSVRNGASSKCETIDCSNEIPIATTAWLQYIAYNKNYYQMGVDIPRERANNATVGAGFNMVGGLLGGVARIISGDIFGGIGAVADRIVSQAGNIEVSQRNADTTIKQNQLEWDNIKNSPNKIKTLGTNIGLYSIYPDFKVFIKELPENDRKTLEVLFYRSGYKYGANVDTYSKLFVCTNFNYVKLGEPLFARYYGENLTDIQRDLLSEILSRGITYFEPSWFVTHGLDYPETNPYKETV